MKGQSPNKFDTKLQFVKNPIVYLASLGFVGLMLRVYYFPYNIPISLDGADYFLYATAIVQLGQFPIGILGTNDGWSIFLSVFFYFLNSTNFMDYMDIQRWLSVIISVITIIPVYLLCKKFVESRFALIGASIFIFDPRLIQNSLLGLTEPLYVFLSTLTILFILSKNIKLVYMAFVTAALSSITRYEGLLFIIPLSIVFFIRFRKEKRYLIRYLSAVIIFILILLPVALIRIENNGQDGLTSHLFSGSKFISQQVISGIQDTESSSGIIIQGNNLSHLIFVSLFNTIKYFGWIMIPIFVFFIPVGIYIIIKNKDKKIITLLIFAIFMLIPASYAYSRDIQEVRYLYVIFPILCVLSCHAFKITEKITVNNTIVVLIMVGVFSASLTFLEYKKDDYAFERETFLATKYVVDIAKGVNDYPGNKYVKVATIAIKWPALLELDDKGRVTFDLKKIPTDNFESVENYVTNSKDKGLTHLVIMKKNKTNFLDGVFEHESDYPYLIKEFDSFDHGFKNQIRIYKINYDMLSDFNYSKP